MGCSIRNFLFTTESTEGRRKENTENLVFKRVLNKKQYLFFGSSDKSVPCLVEGLDFEFEVFEVTEAVGAAFEGFDFVVQAFQRAGRQREGVAVQDFDPVLAERLRKRLHFGDARPIGVVKPQGQRKFRSVFILRLPQVLKGQVSATTGTLS